MFLDGRPAGQRRRHQRRRPVRRHAGDLQRRARRQAVQHLRRVDLAVPDLLGQLHEPVAALPVRAAGLLAGALLLRHRLVLLRPGLQPDLPGPRQRAGHAHDARRQRLRHLPVRPLSPARAVRQRHQLQRALQRPDAGGVLEQLPGRDLRHAVVPRTAPRCRSAWPSCRRRRCSASSGRCRATRCGCRTRWRRRSATRCRTRPRDLDVRKYIRLGGSGLLALRGKCFKSWGDAPDFTYFGGNSELRGYEYLAVHRATTCSS